MDSGPRPIQSSMDESLSGSEKKLKLTQISKFLSPMASTTAKLNDLNNSPTQTNEIKKKTTNKLNFFKLNSSSLLDDSTQMEIDAEKIENTPFNCPICAADLSTVEKAQRQIHVNQCLDQGYSSKPKSFKKSKSDLTCFENKKTTTTATAAPPPPPQLTATATPVIEEEKQKKFTELMLKDAVPNCPICGKVFHSLNVFYFLFYFSFNFTFKINTL